MYEHIKIHQKLPYRATLYSKKFNTFKFKHVTFHNALYIGRHTVNCMQII